MLCIAFSAPEEDVEESEPEEHAESTEEGAAQVEVVAVGGEEGREAVCSRRGYDFKRSQRSQLTIKYLIFNLYQCY